MDDEPDIAENEEVKRFIAHARFKPIMVDLDEFGRVTFGPINARLFFKAATLLQITDPREFALEFTYALIKNPEITLEEWRSLSTQKLVDIVAFIVAHHDRLAPYSSSFDPTDPFPSFKASVQRYYNDAKERWDKAIQSIHYTLPKIDPNKILAPLFDLQPSWVNALAPIVESWRISQAGVFSRLNQTFFQLNIDLKAYETSIAEANEILKKYQWFVSPSLPASFFGTVKRIHSDSSHKRRDINRLFIDYVAEDNFDNVKEMMERWKTNPLFVRHMPILRSALTVLRVAKKSHNPSYVIIPALIAQIDGITIDFLVDRGIPRENGRFSDSEGRSNPITIIKSLLSDSQENGDDPDESSDLVADSYGSGTFLWLDVLFQKALPGQPLTLPTTFSRHKIMHGEFTRYGLMANTVRALLILDFLAELDSRIPRDDGAAAASET